MKIFLNCIKFILVLALTICIVLIGMIGIASSTALDKAFVMKELEKSNFYTDAYGIIESNFENYIYQSGLQPEVLKNICTQEKVTQDINTILSNIYDGTEEKIDTTELENNLRKNIEDSGMNGNKEAVDKFIEVICNVYKSCICHTNYESTINQILVKANNALILAEKVVVLLLGAVSVILLILNTKDLKGLINVAGIGTFASGALTIILYAVFESNVTVEGIKILNDTFSNSLVCMINDILGMILKYSIILGVIGLVLIVFHAIIHKDETKTKKKK